MCSHMPVPVGSQRAGLAGLEAGFLTAVFFGAIFAALATGFLLATGASATGWGSTSRTWVRAAGLITAVVLAVLAVTPDAAPAESRIRPATAVPTSRTARSPSRS